MKKILLKTAEEESGRNLGMVDLEFERREKRRRK
jgi:hypothetical protein